MIYIPFFSSSTGIHTDLFIIQSVYFADISAFAGLHIEHASVITSAHTL